MIGLGHLRELRLRAVRRGVWYRVLDRVERGIISLTIDTVDRVKSLLLAQTLGDIVSKLREALVSPFVRHVEEYGKEKAGKVMEYLDKVCNYAPNWNIGGFSRYLAFLDYNNPVGWRDV